MIYYLHCVLDLWSQQVSSSDFTWVGCTIFRNQRKKPQNLHQNNAYLMISS